MLFTLLSASVNNAKVSIAVSLLSFAIFVITFFPSFVRAGFFKGSLAFAVVFCVKYLVGIAYMMAYASFGVSKDVKTYMSMKTEGPAGGSETQAETDEEKKERLSKEEKYAVAVMAAERVAKDIAISSNFLLQILDLFTMALDAHGVTGPRRAFDKSMNAWAERSVSSSPGFILLDPNQSAKCKIRAIMTYGEAPCDTSKSRGWAAQWDALLDNKMSAGCKARQIFTLGISKCKDQPRTFTQEEEQPIAVERFSNAKIESATHKEEARDPGLRLMNEERFKY
eukprot:jgi/Mesvir1/20219/Mv13457-RA.1